MKELPPAVRKSIEEQKEKCPFCKISSGEIQAKKVYEDDRIMAFLDINPGSKGHTILTTKEHYPIMPYIQDDDFERLFGLIGQISEAVQRATLADSINVFIANGYVAGQMSNHFIVHIIPRNKDDSLEMLSVKGEATHDAQQVSLISNNLLIMAEQHFKEHPAEWHKPRNVESKPVRKFTKEQVIRIIEANPQLKEVIIKAPDALKNQISSNSQLAQLFQDVNVEEIIKHFSPDWKNNESNNVLSEEVEEKKDKEKNEGLEKKDDKKKNNGEKSEENQKENQIPEKNGKNEKNGAGLTRSDLDDISKLFG